MKKIPYILCLLLLVSLVVTACRPRNVLSARQMEDIFVDLHTMDALIQEAGMNYGHDEEIKGYYQQVLERHGITQAQFDSSLVWYTANPTVFDKIYPKVVARLEQQYEQYEIYWNNQYANLSSSFIDDWLKKCQEGYKLDYWQKKEQKSAEKFVYVLKI
ncbi:MAG: DUF4296 domain-containing protein [Paludibacteraceae bacterium]|nr:DUF4296 domain-containing protein [Paludibacteraceae bacterium]